MIGLYVFGIVMGILMALIFKKTAFKGEAVPFVMELPNYRLPGAKNVGHLLWDKAKDFLQRAFTVIFIATIVIWFLQNFDTGLNMTADSQNSILALVAGGLAPIFLPVGFGDWRIVTALISGFLAKESVVSSLTILFGSRCICKRCCLHLYRTSSELQKSERRFLPGGALSGIRQCTARCTDGSDSGWTSGISAGGRWCVSVCRKRCQWSDSGCELCFQTGSLHCIKRYLI